MLFSLIFLNDSLIFLSLCMLQYFNSITFFYIFFVSIHSYIRGTAEQQMCCELSYLYSVFSSDTSYSESSNVISLSAINSLGLPDLWWSIIVRDMAVLHNQCYFISLLVSYPWETTQVCLSIIIIFTHILWDFCGCCMIDLLSMLYTYCCSCF